MNLTDDPAQARFRAELRTWLRDRLPPRKAVPPQRWEGTALRDWCRELNQAGYAGLTWPTLHGGRGLSVHYQAIFAEESAMADAPEPNVIGMNMVGPALIGHGTPAQQHRFLPAILSGEVFFCQGFSEPEAGSDLAAVRTEAKLVGDGYVVTGEKVWSSHAGSADYCLLLARAGAPASGRYGGLTCMLLDLRDPAVEVRPLRQISGDADFAQIVLSGARVPADNVVGEVGQGWSVAMATLAHERGTFGITLTARLAAQFRRLIETAHEAGVIDDPLVRHELADLYVALDALRLTGYRAISSSGGPGPESTVLKLAWSTLDQRMCALAMRLSSDSKTAALELWRRYWLHQRLRSRASSIEGGTSEILRSLIAERVLGLPRSR